MATIVSTPEFDSPIAQAARLRPREQREHLPVLDGVRGLAILMVLIHHLAVLPNITLMSWGGIDVGVLGSAGVDLFFVLSGFLITGILLDNKGQPHYFRNFYARRTLRIFPLYYAVIFLALIVLPRLPHAAFNRFREPVDPWSYWLYLSNFSMALGDGFRHGALDVTWSLAIEEQFYLVWPLVVLLLGGRALVGLCTTMLAASLALRTGLVLAGARWEMTFLLTPCRWDGLIIGALIALAWRNGGFGQLLRLTRWLALVCAGLLMLILTQGLAYYRTPLGQSLGPTLVAIIFGAVLIELLTAREQSNLQRIMSVSWLRLLGKFSYALYLMHVAIFAGLYQAIYVHSKMGGMTWMRSAAGQTLFCLLAVGVCLGVAWVSWHLFEKHFLSLKRYFPSGAPTRAPAAEHVWRPSQPALAGGALHGGFFMGISHAADELKDHPAPRRP